MRWEVRFLPAAWEDLKKIEDYYTLTFGLETALRVCNHILDVVERLSDFPDSGSYTPDPWLNEFGYRMVIAGKHIAIYRCIGEKIWIYHIADTRSDYTKLFG